MAALIVASVALVASCGVGLWTRKVVRDLRAAMVDIETRPDLGYDTLLRDLNLRVARAEATITATAASIPPQPDIAAIIAAATDPIVTVLGPRPFTPDPQPTNVPNDDGDWDPDTFDPFDIEFPAQRATDDYTPPAAFGGLDIPGT